MVLCSLTITALPGCYGGKANDQGSPPPTLVATVTVSRTRGPGLDAAIWAGYGVPIARPTEYATIVPIAEPDVQPSAQLRSARVPVYEGGNWQYLVEQYGDWDWNTVARIIGCESGGSATAVSRTGDVGLLQVNLIHGYSVSQLQDPAFNVRVGHDLWLDGGYTPWQTSRYCWA